MDLEGADQHIASISPAVRSTWSDSVVGGFGGFATGVRIPDGYEDPVVMMTTDGVGTKLELARQSGNWAGVGFDLVAMCVDDLVAVGAEPIGFVDYMAVGALQPERDKQIVESIARACVEAGCPLLGGETAEHPGVMEPDAVDLAGAATGVVDRARALGPERVGEGDVIVGLRSPNLRSNGFSLVRALFDDGAPFDELLAPSVIYTPAVLSARDHVSSAAHITGGGLPGNLQRSLPDGLGAEIDSGSWEVPAVFEMVAAKGVSEEEMYSTFNMGIGFCLVVAPSEVDRAASLTSRHDPTVIGAVVTGSGVRIR